MTEVRAAPYYAKARDIAMTKVRIRSALKHASIVTQIALVIIIHGPFGSDKPNKSRSHCNLQVAKG